MFAFFSTALVGLHVCLAAIVYVSATVLSLGASVVRYKFRALRNFCQAGFEA